MQKNLRQNLDFERRRKGELTTEYLGRILKDYLNLPEMASRARMGHFDDYFCPPEVDDGMNMHRLVYELQRASKARTMGGERRKRIKTVIMAVKDGEFDGTSEEANRWAMSKLGQETLKQFLEE